MSVIGRLDEQVARVLIAPLEKNQLEPSAEDIQRETDKFTAATKDRKQMNDQQREESEELPVWLL
jgi:hypothetical protein